MVTVLAETLKSMGKMKMEFWKIRVFSGYSSFGAVLR